MVDHFTKFAVAAPIHNQTTRITAQMAWKHFSLPYGCLEEIQGARDPVVNVIYSKIGATRYRLRSCILLKAIAHVRGSIQP